MSTDMKKKRQATTVREPSAASTRHQHEAQAGVAGALAGAAMGSIGGPTGAAAGALIGGIVAAVATGVAQEDAAERAAFDRDLDTEIGVTGGDIGSPNLFHPDTPVELYSSSFLGTSANSESESAEGPMQNPQP
jgi:hypothetical protein